MDIKVQNFLGRVLVIPQDRLYDPTEGLWVKKQDSGRLAIGLTEATLLMAGSIRDLQMLVEDGAHVNAGDTVLLALTARLKYIAIPISGVLICHHDLENQAAKILEDPYNTELFYVVPDSSSSTQLIDAADYAERLGDSDGARNPGGHKGGASPTCKAVYMGLGQQKLGSN